MTSPAAEPEQLRPRVEALIRRWRRHAASDFSDLFHDWSESAVNRLFDDLLDILGPCTDALYGPLERAGETHDRGPEARRAELATDLALSMFHTIDVLAGDYWDNGNDRLRLTVRSPHSDEESTLRALLASIFLNQLHNARRSVTIARRVRLIGERWERATQQLRNLVKR